MNADFGRALGRYAIFDEIAAGGMATVHLGRLMGPVGFSRTVAIKRLHPHFAHDDEFVAMFLDEARLAARIQHPNVVATLDVVQTDDELFLVMEYIRGESLSWLRREVAKRGEKIPLAISTSAIAGALYGLHAAHEATSEQGVPLGIVHRDVSPQNIMIGNDGVPRVIDFGVAKATSRLQSTRGGQVKGKLSYMAPEQLKGNADRRSDVYAAGVVLWELLTGERLFDCDNDGQLIVQLMQGCQRPPSQYAPHVPRALDDVVMWALAVDPDRRCPTARDLAIALEGALRPATARELAEWLDYVAGPRLATRVQRVAEIESLSSAAGVVPSPEFPGDLASARVVVEPPSQGTQLTASSSNAAPDQGGRRLLVAVLSVSIVIVLAGGVALAFLGRSPSSPAALPSAEAPLPEVVTAPVATSSAQPRELPAAPLVSTEPPPRLVPSVAGPLPRGGPLPPKPPVEARPPPPPTPAAPPPARTDCDPPYTIDSSGVKRYKPACL